MQLLQIFMIAFSLAMDAFSVSVTDGMILKKPKVSQAVKIGLFFGIFQFIMPCIGWVLAAGFSGYIDKIDHWLAFAILTFIGGKMILEALKNASEEEDEDDKDPLAVGTLTLMAVATSIDALAVGITLDTMGAPLLLSATVIGAVAFMLSLAGVYIGSCFGGIFGKKAEVVGGAVLIIIGVKILIEQLFF